MLGDSRERPKFQSTGKPVRCAVLATEKSWHFRDMRRAAKKITQLGRSEVEVQACGFGGIAGGLLANRANFSLNADVIFARLMPAGTLEQIVFRMDLLQRLMLSGVPVINPPKAIEVCVDKYLCLAKLAAAGLPVPDTQVSQTYDQALLDFERLGGDVVVKPIFGSMGRGLERLTNVAQAEDCFEYLIDRGAVVYQQRFVPHGGGDLRLFVIDQRVWAMRRKATSGWITNISQGGQGVIHQPTDQEIDLALRATRAVGATIAGVDLLYDETTGQGSVIEINASVGWKEISRVLEVDFAEEVLLSILRNVDCTYSN